MNDECKNFLGFKKCKLKPRYNYEEIPIPNHITGDDLYYMDAEEIDSLKPIKKTYIHDICVSCGKIFK